MFLSLDRLWNSVISIFIFILLDFQPCQEGTAVPRSSWTTEESVLTKMDKQSICGLCKKNVQDHLVCDLDFSTLSIKNKISIKGKI
jgi:hypothetical protein